jgi:hypothetical protein
MKPKNPESGQAIVLIALFMIGLLAMLGLSLDGGGMFYLNRDLANAVDAGAWVGTYALCNDGDVEAAVLEIVAENGFNREDELVRSIVIDTELTVVGKYNIPAETLRVSATAEKVAYFIDFVYKDPLLVTRTAVGQCQRSYASASESTITALSSTCQNAVDLSGSNIQIVGDILSNEGIKVSTSSGNIMGGGYYTTSAQTNDNTVWYPDEDNPAPLPAPIINDMPWEEDLFLPGGEYYEAALAEGMLTVIDNSSTYVVNNAHLEGLYVLTGGADFRTVGQSITIGPKGLTVVSVGGGRITFSGNGIDLNPYVPGLLLYSTAVTTCGGSAISFSSSNAEWSGDLYAPYGGISVSDSNASSFDSSIVGQTVKISSSNTQLGNNFQSAIIPPEASLVE